MATKPQKDQELARRTPRQARSLHKVGLILEAAMRLIEKDGLDVLTTNAIAERAGVSIGTLYQYFNDKQAVLDALAERELAGLSQRVMAALQGPMPFVPGGRIRAVVQAVLGSYGGRRRVHRLLLEHAMARGTGGQLGPMVGGIAELFSSTGIAGPGRAARKLTPAEAFVLTQSIAGVLRALATARDSKLDRVAVEDALVRLVMGYLDGR